MITTSKAVVLKAIPFQESSIIANVLTDNQGKQALIAKGARRPKSPMRAMLEPGNLISVVYNLKQGRDMHVLRQADIVEKTYKLRYDPGKFSSAIRSLELIEQLVHPGEQNPAMFAFTETFLVWLSNVADSVTSIFPYVQLRLAAIMGIGIAKHPNLNSSTGNEVVLDVGNGLVTNHRDGFCIPLNSWQAWYLETAIDNKGKLLLDASPSAADLNNLTRHLDVYLSHHIEGLRDRRSDSVFSQIL